jgi:fructokinase
MGVRIGVDLGGTKIECAALDSNGVVVERQRIPAPQGSYPKSVEAISGLILAVEEKLGEQGTVGVGIPGVISPATGLVKNCNSVWVNGNPLDRDLAKALGREVRVANDANCFALSEAMDGAGEDGHVVFGAILGTGTGGGVVIDKKVLVGRHAIAGEWGHNPLAHLRADETGVPPCFCGRRDCNENFLSGRGLRWAYEQVSGKQASAEEIPVMAKNGAPDAIKAMENYYDRLARALSAVINLIDPDAIVIGGGLSDIDTIYEEVPPRLAEYVFSDICTTPVLKNRHGDSSGVRGAAWLWGR